MALALAAAVTVPVGDIFAMSDAELAQFIQEHRLPNGNYDRPIDGWDKLSKEERSHVAERLEAQKRGLAQSPTACSRPLDLDDLDARLRQASSQKGFSLRPEPQVIDRSGTSTPPFDPVVQRTIPEIEAYHELVNDGGRPLYSVDLVLETYRDPDKYAEILRPWQETLTQVWAEGIFKRQLQRWQDFRKWQNDNRGREDDDGGFPAYVERQKYTIQQECIGLVEWQKYILPRESRKQAAAEKKEATAKRLAEIDADPSCLKSRWEDIQWERERQRRRCRERGCRGFRDYAEAVKRRLARHGFTQPFELDEDPKKQDKLTTWIEYLNYECWWLDNYTSDIERLESENDQLWQELVNEKFLRPRETKKFVLTNASRRWRQTQKDEAEKAVQRAESEAKRIYVLTQKDPNRLRIPTTKRASMLKHGNGQLLAARGLLEQARRRSSLIGSFVRAMHNYDKAKRYTACHRVLVQWALNQAPIVEAEMNVSEANGSETARTRTVKRKRTNGEESPETRSLKRVRVGLQELRLTSASAPSKATEAQAEPGVAMDRGAAQGSQLENPAASSSHQDVVQAMP